MFHHLSTIEAEVFISVLKCTPMSTELLNRITSNPRQCGGRPCIRGMRIRVKDVLDMLAGGATQEEILADYPDLEAEVIRASHRLRGPVSRSCRLGCGLTDAPPGGSNRSS